METIHSYKDLIVWQKAMDLVVLIYGLTKSFPEEEKYSLTNQMRRCVVSIPSNIAEGRRRGSQKDYRQFLIIAYGSGAELETQIEIADRLGFGKGVEKIKAKDLLTEVMKMLNKMISLL
ncbi:MAG: four helix bundle protein [Candidatus Uhrbacteria bacterium]|nr:four helix bundle protein [Candidatus Uhrbacteria bacterium]